MFGEWVKQTRIAKGLSEAECARRAGMSAQRWNRMEKTVQHPERATAEKIATTLDVPIEEALQAAGYLLSAGMDDARMRFGRRLDRILRILPPEERDRIEKMLEQDANRYVALLKPYLASKEPGPTHED